MRDEGIVRSIGLTLVLREVSAAISVCQFMGWETASRHDGYNISVE